MSKNYKSLLEEVAEKTAEINKIKAVVVEKLRVQFRDIFQPYLDKYPEVSFFRWAQYTPYFNDGNPCVFSVQDLYGFMGLPEEDDYEGALCSWSRSIDRPWVMSAFGGDEDRALKALEDFRNLEEEFSSLPEDIMRDVFGDHARITVSREGIDVEEYEHD